VSAARTPLRALRHGHQGGFGLVEMMVALVLGLLVVGAATVMFIAARQASTSSDNLSRVQDSVRTSYDLMTREVREAGATPCDAQLLLGDVLNNAQGATPAWWAHWNTPLMGYDGATAFPGAADGTGVAQRVAGTAAVIVRYGSVVDGIAVATHDTANARFTANRANHGIAVGDLLLVCNYRQGAIFNVTAVNAVTGTFSHDDGTGTSDNCSKGLGLPTVCTSVGSTLEFSAGSLVSRLTAVGWYIGNNGRPSTGGRSLYRVTRNGPEEVAEGVRNMQITYLMDSAADYDVAASVTDWSRVTSLRFDLTYEGADAGVSTTAAGARITRPVGFTVNLRNLQP
jgi:type IV pilus assembly protein PilW